MNDYKELIAKCNYWINLGDEMGKKLAITKFMEECRDAIEQLVKERDAAMADITHNCKSCMKKCVISDALNRLHNGECDEWVWRGVSKVQSNG